MLIKIIGLVIGVLVLGAGIYYLSKEKEDPESRKIYTVVSIVGAVIAIVCALLLFL
jgi:4-hydroxybenzoate polyprenyltransferase